MIGNNRSQSGADGPDTARTGRVLIHRQDFILAVLIWSICGILYWATTRFEKVAQLFAQDVPPEFFPRLLLLTIAVLTLGLPFEHLLLRRRGESPDTERRQRITPIAFATVALLAATVAAIPWLGTLPALVVVCLALPMLWGERRPLVLIPFAVVFPGLVAFLFAFVLGVHFEPGIFAITLR